RRQVAEPALAGSHRHGRVALRKLDRVEALCACPLQILDGDVFADADEALAPVAGTRRRDLADRAGDTADRLDAGRQLGRRDDAAARVVDDARTRLREQRVRRLRRTGSDQAVAVAVTAVH